jgi:hypothetical protein
MRKSSGWKPKKDKWNWRKFLTVEEVDIIKVSDAALAALEKQRANYNKKHGATRQFIVNRAIHRAKYSASKKALAS